MRASRLHQGLRFLPIRCGFRFSGLRFKLSGLGLCRLRVSGLRPMGLGRLSGCCFPKQFTCFKHSRAEADDAKRLKLRPIDYHIPNLPIRSTKGLLGRFACRRDRLNWKNLFSRVSSNLYHALLLQSFTSSSAFSAGMLWISSAARSFG